MKNKIIPHSYHLIDYCAMFDLTAEELKSKRILDYLSGQSSFNAELTEKFKNNINVISLDSLYALSFNEMAKHVDPITHLTAKNFLEDYKVGKEAGRYRSEVVVPFPFQNEQFDLALCVDLLVSIKPKALLSLITELCRVAKEVRFFPFMENKTEIANVWGPLLLSLQKNNYGIEIKKVKSGTMLRVWSLVCLVTS